VGRAVAIDDLPATNAVIDERCHCEARSAEAISCLTGVPRLVRQGIALSLRSSQ
jgi:hypothetical protein